METAVSRFENDLNFRARKNIFFECKGPSNSDMKSYFYSTDLTANWLEAHLTCRSYGLNLLSLNSAEEYEHFKCIFIKNAALFEVHTYIGGTRMNSNDWYWVNNGQPISAIRWARGEPNGGRVKDYCTDIIREGNELAINDLPCHGNQYYLKFICERSFSQY